MRKTKQNEKEKKKTLWWRWAKLHCQSSKAAADLSSISCLSWRPTIGSETKENWKKKWKPVLLIREPKQWAAKNTVGTHCQDFDVAFPECPGRKTTQMSVQSGRLPVEVAQSHSINFWLTSLHHRQANVKDWTSPLHFCAKAYWGSRATIISSDSKKKARCIRVLMPLLKKERQNKSGTISISLPW